MKLINHKGGLKSFAWCGGGAGKHGQPHRQLVLTVLLNLTQRPALCGHLITTSWQSDKYQWLGERGECAISPLAQ